MLDLCCSYCIFIKFILSSQHFPHSSSLYPIFFALSFTLENLYMQPKRHMYFGIIQSLIIYLFLVDQTKMPIHIIKKILKKLWRFSQLIHTQVTIYYHVKVPQQSFFYHFTLHFTTRAHTEIMISEFPGDGLWMCFEGLSVFPWS